MISSAQARSFAEDWIAAWNSHDLDRVLDHYTDDFELSSPFIVYVANEPSGKLKGKEAVRQYWEGALTLVPDLHFELIQAMTGINSIIIHYRSVGERLAAETMFFDEGGKVTRVIAHYSEV
ncbi:MAG: nuclear transport factor 2 family protein [Phycisphaerae bacterium]|nr:nuclear transport factor 2 family protein [Phycisphaerae bacterium]